MNIFIKEINKFRTHLDRERNSLAYTLLSPIKQTIAENMKQKGCFYFPEINAVFYHSPKCGGTSIYKTLGEKYEMHRINKNKAIKIKDVFNFTFVRNPYSRLVSSYKFLAPEPIIQEKFNIPKNPSFKEFIEIISKIKDKDSDIHFTSFSKFLRVKGSLSPLDFIGRVENIQEDFDNLCDILEIPRLKLKHENKTNHDDWEKYYNSELKKIVFRRYREDFGKFGYEK